MIQSTIGMLGVLAGMGLGLTATKYVAELRVTNKLRAGRILGICSAATLACGAAASIALIATAPSVAHYVLADSSLSQPLRLGAGLVVLNAFNGYQTAALAGFEAFSSIASVALWSGLFSFPAMTLLTWYGGLNGAVLGLSLSVLFNCMLNLVCLRRECKRANLQSTLRGWTREISVLWQFALPALLTSVLLSPAMWICNAWLARQPAGYAELGAYGAADRFRLAILFIPSSVFTTVVPLLSALKGDGDGHGFRTVFRANLFFNLAVVLIPTVIVAIFSKTLMAAFGSSYRSGWLILVVLAFSAIPEALNTILGQPLITNAMWLRLAFDLGLIATLLISAKVLIPIWGGLGLATAYCAAFSLTSVVLAFGVRRHVAIEPAVLA